MSHWTHKLRACFIHLTICLIVLALFFFAVFGFWYPSPYRDISGGCELFFLVMAIDIVMGPLMTLVIFNRNKTRHHLILDFTVIGVLQISALMYGLWFAFVARPVHLVFEYHRMALVHAADIDSRTLAQAPPHLQRLPLTGPTLLSLRLFENASEEFESTMAAINGVPQAAQPALWQSWDSARTEILKEARAATELKQRFIAKTKIIDASIAATGRSIIHLSYLPLLARNEGWTVFIDAETTEPVGFLKLDSF